MRKLVEGFQPGNERNNSCPGVLLSALSSGTLDGLRHAHTVAVYISKISSDIYNIGFIIRLKSCAMCIKQSHLVSFLLKEEEEEEE